MSSFVSSSGVVQGAPLTEAQLGLWYAQRLDPSNPIFNIAHCTEIEGDLNVEVFRQAVDTALAEADVMAMRVVDEGDAGPYQVLDESWRPRLQVVDLTQHAEPAVRAQQLMQYDMQTPVDPCSQPMALHVLYLLEPGKAVWYQRVHHVAADGYGMALIDARAGRLYTEAIGAGDAGEPLLPYADVLAEDAEYRAGERRIRDREYWQKMFADAPASVSLAEGTPISGHRFVQAGRFLDLPLRQALQTAQERTGISWPDILTTLCAAYVARHTGQVEPVVGVPFMGRLGNRSARVPAMVMNVVPLRLQIDEDIPLDQLLLSAERNLRQARRHGRYRSEQLRRDLGLLGGSRRLHGPLINVLPFEKPCALPGLNTRLHVLGAGPVDDFTITFRGNPVEGDMLLTIEANPALYSEATVAIHLARLLEFLPLALASESLATVPTLTAAEHQHWVYGVNDTAHPVPRTTLVELVQRSMVHRPDSVALMMGDASLTYGELDQRSSQLAARLQAAGVRRGDRVALALPRSFDLVIALLAIQRTGAAYLPLDASQPVGRLSAILSEAEPRLLLLQAADTLDIPGSPPVLRVDETSPSNPVSYRAAEVPGPDDPAYVLYTSGSTGLPKGVVITHDAIVNRVLWMQAHYGVSETARILQKTPVTFDVSVWEFFLPLVAGATLVIAPPDAHRDPAWLAQIIREKKVDTLHFVPSMLAAFLDEPAAAGLVLRQVFCSGEALPAALRDRFHTMIRAELHNLYGPTEAAVDVSWWPASREDTSQPVPIGYPVWNTSLYVLDGRRRPVPPGVVGELFLAGRQLATGYLGRPELTAERFVTDPFGQPEARMYATGDLAYWREDGAVVFLGRSDHQVKIRGQRIELGEIEHAFASAPGIAAAVALLRDELPSGPALVVYVVAAEGAVCDEQALKTHAASLLPAVMMPAAVVWLDALPLTANGKLDRKLLPIPTVAVAARSVVIPATGVVGEMAHLFAEVLGQSEGVGAEDDFFALGGHSLLAAKLTLRIRQKFGVSCNLGTVFEHPTPARLVAYLNLQGSTAGGRDLSVEAVSQEDAGFGPVMPLRGASQPTVPALFCVHPAGGLSWCYGTLARSLPAGRAVYGLQALALDPTCREREPASLVEMAAGYVDTMLHLQPEGPYHLLGWSVGGIIAHAMAVELQRRGLKVGALVMLDSYPSDCWRNQAEPPADAVYKALLHIAGYDPTTLTDVPFTHDGVLGFLRRSGHPLGELPVERLDGVIRTVAANNRLVREHHHERFAGTLLHVRAALDHAGLDLSPRYWQPYVGDLEVLDVPSLHAHLTGAEATATLLPVLSAKLSQLDSVREPV